MTMMSHTVSGWVGGWSVWVWVWDRGAVQWAGVGNAAGGGGLLVEPGGGGGASDRVPDWASKLNAYRSQCKVKGGSVLYAFIVNERNLH